MGSRFEGVARALGCLSPEDRSAYQHRAQPAIGAADGSVASGSTSRGPALKRPAPHDAAEPEGVADVAVAPAPAEHSAPSVGGSSQEPALNLEHDPACSETSFMLFSASKDPAQYWRRKAYWQMRLRGGCAQSH